MYEAPDFFELGDACELTLGRRLGNWPDGIPDRLIFATVTDEVEAEEEVEA